MKKLLIFLLSLLVILSFGSCTAERIPETEGDVVAKEEQNASTEETHGILTDTDKYIIQTPFYQIYKE